MPRLLAAEREDGMLGTRRFGMRVAIAALVSMVLLPTGASAAADITFNLALGDRCVYGTKPSAGTLTLTLFSSNGTQRAKGSDASGDARWGVCLKVAPRPGDRLRAVRGSLRRTVTVPTVTAMLERVTDVLSGRAPSGRSLNVLAQHCSLLGECDEPVKRTIRANGRGRYRTDLTSRVDIRGTDLAVVSFETSAGDVFGRYATAPSVMVSGKGYVAVMCAGSADRKVLLRRADGTERARAAFPGPQRCDTGIFARFDQRFARRGVGVSPSVGNVVKADIASDARFVWRGIALELVADTFEGRCFRNAPFLVALSRVDGGVRSVDTLGEGVTDADGTFSAALKPGTVILLDDRVRLVCETPRGDRGALEIRTTTQG
jgi:hypothetical protein